MFNPLRKFFQSAPQPALAAAGMSGAIPLIPSKFGGYTDPALEPKASLGTRILQGLPGAAAQVSIVMGAKAVTTYALSGTLSSALLAGVAPVALTPLITGAGALAAGLAAAQSFKYARERMETLSKEQGRTITLKTIYNECSLAGIAREAALFRKEAFSWNFVKKAVHNGKWGMALGATLGIADHTDIGREVMSVAKEKAGGLLQLAGEKTVNLAHIAKERIQNGLARVNWKNPVQRFAEMMSGKAHADVAPKPSAPAQLAQAADTKPQAQLSNPINTVPVDPPTPLEKIRILTEMRSGPPNAALERLIERAEEGKTHAIRMQAIKDLAVTRDLPVSKELRMDLLKIAAEGKNPQAIRDLAILTKGTVAAPVVDVPKPEKLVARGIAADSRERAVAFIRSMTGSGEAAQQTPAPKVAVPQAAAPTPAPAAPLPTSEIVDRNADTLARAYAQQNAGNVHTDPARQFAHDYALNKAPVQIKNEAARCVMGVGNENGKNVINSMCSWFKAVVTPNDHVLVQSADQSLSAPYSPPTDQPVEKFTPEARRHFRDNDFMPKFGAQL